MKRSTTYIGIALAAILALGVLAAKQWVKLERLVRVQESETGLILVSTAKMSIVLTSMRGSSTPIDKPLEEKTHEALTSMGMVLLAREIDIPSLDAVAFTALCTLISQAESTFPQNGSIPRREANRLIVSQLSGMYAAVLNESAARALRLGGAKSAVCELKGAAAAREVN